MLFWLQMALSKISHFLKSCIFPSMKVVSYGSFLLKKDTFIPHICETTIEIWFKPIIRIHLQVTKDMISNEQTACFLDWKSPPVLDTYINIWWNNLHYATYTLVWNQRICREFFCISFFCRARCCSSILVCWMWTWSIISVIATIINR